MPYPFRSSSNGAPRFRFMYTRRPSELKDTSAPNTGHSGRPFPCNDQPAASTISITTSPVNHFDFFTRVTSCLAPLLAAERQVPARNPNTTKEKRDHARSLNPAASSSPHRE